ncbi:Snt309p NDAI_0A04880 [Naumovozyma dairenensis CBS 421]|uniref:Pre-mRNA-splicing factor SPF27 n=1 Tax=Naumovozyma dairenensis (strain ATCC 10597 / BCRC 20456 / CBS 421 / NBRC 0211 / NRRL Y-12639) TaxID=1071378 RepID=G0W4A5_NAUDC|nr:hypothetical protein NDAI_0A04880 [Naumovozyma dairenensis CBS 421]CCD22643.1 hypothetical protein NDAI_0A04880 [Naumovozyma dairenensis CBS 421]
MDYLPFIDSEDYDADSISQVEKEIKREYAQIEKDKDEDTNLHPEVIKLLNLWKVPTTTSHFDTELLDEYMNPRKRKFDENEDGDEDEDALEERILEICSKKYPRIDLSRYFLNSDDEESLCITHAYIEHQEVLLKDCLSKTLTNQWAINNEFIKESNANLNLILEKENKNLVDLMKYRENAQLKNKPIFDKLKQKWKDNLIQNVLGTAPSD